MFLYKVINSLNRQKVRYAIAGGYAVALHGAVRGTVDVDIVIALTKANIMAVESALKKIGLRARLPIQAADLHQRRKEFIENRNLVAWNFSNPKNAIEQVDIIVTEELRRAKTMILGRNGHRFRVLSIEDLIRMKKKSGRPQDREDIKALRRLK